METTMTLADGTVEPTVDLMNDHKIGVDAISPAALPLVPQEIQDLVKQRRDQMMKGEWDPFTAHEFVSNGTGLDLTSTGGPAIPAAGTVVKPADQAQTPEWLLSEFNFDLQGTTILQ
jgi:basic membrane protein A